MKRRFASRARTLAAALTLAVIPATADAADLPPPPEPAAPTQESPWDVAIAAYVWGASLSGDVGVGGFQPVQVDASFGDILSKLDMAFMAVGEVRYDRFGVFGDLLYTSIAASGTGPLGFVDADLRSEVTTATLMGQGRVAETDRASLDLMAGGRLWNVSNKPRLSGPLGTRTLRDSETWIDPMIGAKGRAEAPNGVFVTGWAMIGGFGVGSDLGWDLFGGVGYEVTKRISIVAGYRGLGIDYENDGFVFDVIEHGPAISGVVRF